MLNEKVTVTICGKAYNLRTDNASSLIRQGEEADRRITEYCREMSLSKDDACVFTVLDLLGDLDSANAQRDSYAKKNAALVSTAEKGAKALEENKQLASENELLAKDIAALKSENEELSALREKAGMYEELTVKFSQIENENAALRAGAGSDASEGAAPAQMEELKKQLSDALAEVKELRKINASLNRQLNEMLEDGQLTL